MATGSGQIHLEDPTSDDYSPIKQTSTVQKEIDEPNKSNEESTENETRDSTNKVHQYLAKNDDKNVLDMKYSSYAENSLVFWWIGDVPNVT